MASSTLGFFIFSITVCLVAAQHGDGRSDFCLEEFFDPVWHITPPERCCGENGICKDWLRPNQTKHGLTNRDGKWSRRLCSCDQEFYRCMTKNLSADYKDWARRSQFWDVMCFEKIGYHYVNGVFYHEKYVFRRLLDTLRLNE